MKVANAATADGETPGVLFLGNFLSRRLHTRTVAEELAERLEGAGWKVFRASRYPAKLPRLLDTLSAPLRHRRRVDVAQVDVYSGTAFFQAEAAAWALRRAGTPFALTLHGGELPAFARTHPKRVRRLFSAAGAITAPSPFLVRELAPYAPQERPPEVIPNPLDLSAYPHRVRSRPEPRLVWLRAYHRTYNPELAPRVLARVAERFPDVKLTMIGPDKGDGSRGATLAAARELGVADRLTLRGGVPKAQVGAELARGDLFLNTTNADNTPVSVVEAMACGLCVVSTEVGGLATLLSHGEDALLAPPGDDRTLAAAVVRLLEEPALAETLSRAGRRKAEETDFARVLPRWQDLLRRLAAGSPLPSPVSTPEAGAAP